MYLDQGGKSRGITALLSPTSHLAHCKEMILYHPIPTTDPHLMQGSLSGKNLGHIQGAFLNPSLFYCNIGPIASTIVSFLRPLVGFCVDYTITNNYAFWRPSCILEEGR